MANGGDAPGSSSSSSRGSSSNVSNCSNSSSAGGDSGSPPGHCSSAISRAGDCAGPHKKTGSSNVGESGSRSSGGVQKTACIHVGRSPRDRAASSHRSSRSVSDDDSSSSCSCNSSRDRRAACTTDSKLASRDSGRRMGDSSCNNSRSSSNNPGSPGHQAAFSPATWRMPGGRFVYLWAPVVLLLGTLNQVLGKIRAKALGRFDSVVAISNALMYTVVYFVLMVLLWTKHIPWDNISFVWSTVETSSAPADIRHTAASAAAADTEEQEIRQGLRAPLLDPQRPEVSGQKQQDVEAGGTALPAPSAASATPAAGEEGGAGERRRGRRGAWPWLVVTGCCDACGNILGFLAQPYVPGPYYVMALQAVVPFSCLCSMLLLKRRYTCYHLLALVLVIVGVVIPVVPAARRVAVDPSVPSGVSRAEQHMFGAFARDFEADVAYGVRGGRGRQRGVALRWGDSTAGGAAAPPAAAAPPRGRPGDDGRRQRPPAQQMMTDSPASAGASAALSHVGAEAPAAGGSGLDGALLKRGQDDAAAHYEESRTSMWDAAHAVLGGRKADRGTRIVKSRRGGDGVTAARVNCVDYVGEEDGPAHASADASVSREDPMPLPDDRGGNDDVGVAPAVVCAVGCSRRMQRQRLRQTSQKADTHQRRLKKEGRMETILSKNEESGGAPIDTHAFPKTAEDGMQVDSNESLRAKTVREEAAAEVNADLSHTAANTQGGSDKISVLNDAAADARRFSTSETRRETASPVLRSSSVARTILCMQKNGIKRKPLNEAGRKEDGASNSALLASEFVVSAADGRAFAREAPAELRGPPPKQAKAEAENTAEDIAMWLYLCLAALSTFPTALSFAVKEKMIRQYEQLHAAENCNISAAAVAADDGGTGSLQRQAVDVRAVGVAKLIPSGHSSATDTNTSLVEQSGRWSSGSGGDDILLQMSNLSCVSSKTQSLLRLYSGDTQVGSSSPALAAVADANSLERLPASSGEHGRWTEGGGGLHANCNSSSSAERDSRGGVTDDRQSTGDALCAATACEEGAYSGRHGGYIESSSSSSSLETRDAVADEMAAQCCDAEQGADTAVLIGGRDPGPPNPEAREHHLRSSSASGFARDGDCNQKPARRLHVIVVCAHCSAFQLLWALASLPLSSWLGETNKQSIPEFAADALRCFAGSSTVESQIGSSSLPLIHTRNVSDVELCPYALRAYAVYLGVNIVFNLSLIGFAAAASSLLTFVTLKATLPLGILFYALIPWPLLEKHDVTVDTSVFVCLAFILTGVTWFHWESLRCQQRFGSSSAAGNPPCCWPLRPQVLLRCFKRCLSCGVNCLERCWTWGQRRWQPRY